MTARVLDELARLAAGAEPPTLDDSVAERMVERALAAPARRAPARSRAWLPAAAVAVAAVAIAWLRPGPRAPEPELLHVALPTGDQLVGTARAEFDLERVDRADRRVHLRSGTLLAEVAHVVPGQRFAIATAHLVATARGTIFAVDTDAARTRVHVFEGTVEIAQGGEVRLLAAGTMWTSDLQRIAVEPARPPALAAEIVRAIEHRAAEHHELERTAASRVATAEPSAPEGSAATTPPARHSEPVATPPAGRSEPAAPRANDTTPGPSLDDLLASARAALAAGKLDEALAIANRAAARGATTGAWRIVTADALRGLGRTAEAVDAFETAAHELSGAEAFEAGYSAAYLALRELRDPDRALVALVTARVDAEDSPLEERGLVLHVRILEALHREADAKPIATRYLARYPHGELRDRMQALAK